MTNAKKDIIGRDESLDVVKSILIVCVVLGHAMREGSWQCEMDTFVLGFIYRFHMPLFVLLCGYFFKFDAPLVMVRKIFLRYWLPYLSGGLLFVIGLGIFKGTSYVASMRNLLFGRGLGAMWFLYSIAAIESVLCTSYATFRRNRELGIFSALGMFVIAILLPIRVESWSVFYFLCGILLKGNLPDCRWGVAFGLLAVSVLWVTDLPWYTEITFVSICFVSCIGVILLWIAKWLLKFKFGCRLAWLGRQTMVILIFHPLFNLVLFRAIPFFASIDKTGLLFWVVESILGIVGCLVVGNMLQRTKIGVLFGVRV